MSQINFTMDPEHALHFVRDTHDYVGHLYYFGVGSDVSLSADLKLTNPIGFRSTQVAGVLSSLEWGGSPESFMTIKALVSMANRQLIMNIVHQDVSDPSVMLSFSIYDYDNVKLKFFEALYTEGTKLKGKLETSSKNQNNRVKVSIEIESKAAVHKKTGGPFSPMLWEMTATIYPGSDSQNIRLCTGGLQKMVKKWGVPKT
jgi:hypothetical protein